MQKIALISEHASPLAAIGGVDAGGQNIYVANVAKQLVSHGYRVDVFTRRDNTSLPDIVPIGHNIRVIHVPAGPPCEVPKEQLLPFMPAFAEFMVRHCAQTSPGYDVLHANFFMSGQVGLRVRQVLDIPLVVTFHALGHVRRRCQGASDTFPDERIDIENTLVQTADAIIAECPQDEADLVTLYGADPQRIEIVPCGFDASEFHPIARATARAALGWQADEFSILQLGRLVPRKGIDNVIRAVSLLVREVACGRPVKLYIVGGPDYEVNLERCEALSKLAALADELGVVDHVDFVGRRNREALRYFYSAADVFVTTPWYEPFGITPVEAMACATPVIGSDVGGIRTTVVDGQTGFLVPAQAPDALAGRLAQLRDNRCLAHRLGLAGAQRANRHFRWSGVADQLCAVYARVLNPQRNSANIVTLPALRTMTVRPAVPVSAVLKESVR
ncbi:glycosyltransferase family 4 protein [Pandoraea sputorum]|uniref:Glycosyl transferase family 1 n=1 Tax=Pandoraea sputorum TaxID=93222 RepID=A0A5E5BEE4_9BURK|nr:glycosyltransferase family 1 protein [Pandoraea sputorum]VVE84571.1 glycosyl transferase family 1 [Pandoraea sputorum]